MCPVDPYQNCTVDADTPNFEQIKHEFLCQIYKKCLKIGPYVRTYFLNHNVYKVSESGLHSRRMCAREWWAQLGLIESCHTCGWVIFIVRQILEPHNAIWTEKFTCVALFYKTNVGEPLRSQNLITSKPRAAIQQSHLSIPDSPFLPAPS